MPLWGLAVGDVYQVLISIEITAQIPGQMLGLDETLPEPMWVMGETFLLHGSACYHLIVDTATVNPLLSFKINISLGFKSTLKSQCLTQSQEASDSLLYVVNLALFWWLLPWFERAKSPPPLLSHCDCVWHWIFVYTYMKWKVFSST